MSRPRSYRTARYIWSFLLCTCVSVAAGNRSPAGDWRAEGDPVMVRAIYVDHQGVKWFATSQGVRRYDAPRWTYYNESNYLPGDQVFALAMEETDLGRQLWVATSAGVALLDVTPDGVTGATSYSTEDGLLDDSVTGIAIDSHRRKFFGSASGITWMRDWDTGTLTYEDYPGSLVDASIRQLDIYNDTLYIAAEGGIGRFVSDVDGITGATRWTSEYGVTPFSGNIRSLEVGGVNQQWFGTDAGVELHTGYEAKQNWSLYSTAEGLVQNDVLVIAGDPEGGMWFGTRGGVSRLKDDTWTSYTRQEGLISDTVYAIALDTDGSVWFGTHRGACRLHEGEFVDFYTGETQFTATPAPLTARADPSAGRIHMAYYLESPTRVSARLYSIDGRLAGSWEDLPGNSGLNRTGLSMEPISRGMGTAGIHILQLVLSDRTETVKILITP